MIEKQRDDENQRGREPQGPGEGTSKRPEPKKPGPEEDRVEEADEESFPASDPPFWSPLRTGTPNSA